MLNSKPPTRDPHCTLLPGDAAVELKRLPGKSIDCVVTSPPYWALRDYGVDGQLGHEPHIELFIERLCQIFTEVRRVLKKTGTCFVVLGDTYSGRKVGHTDRLQAQKIMHSQAGLFKPQTLARKSLCLIPFRFALAMVQQGWLLRNTIIWHKPNAMPQSVRDRFTVDFEYVLFFTVSSRYYFNPQYEPMNTKENAYRYALRQTKRYQSKAPYKNQLPKSNPAQKPGRNKRSVWSIPTKAYRGAHVAPYPEALIKTPILAGCPENGTVLDPFLGSGTTAKVALALGRRCIGIELNPAYIKLARGRVGKIQ